MSSNLSTELKRLNTGQYPTFRYYPSNRNVKDKVLEIIGVIPRGTFCFICEKRATCEYNDYRVCTTCFKSLSKKKESQMYRKDRLVQYNGHWLSEQFLDFYSDKEYDLKYGGRNPGNHHAHDPYDCEYESTDPEEMLKITFLGQKKQVDDLSICISCKEFIKHSDEEDNSCYFENNYACLNCNRTSQVYFDLKLITYLFLKELFPEEPNIAKHAVLYHHKIKLRNCLRD